MSKQTEALKLALEELNEGHIYLAYDYIQEALASEAIEQPAPAPEVREQQEPVAWVVEDQNGERLEWAEVAHIGWGWKKLPLYTTPPAAPVQELVAWMHKETGLLRQANKAKGGDFEPNHWTPLYTAIEQALAAPYVASQLVQEPVATLIDHYGFTDGVVRFAGVENMEQLPIGTKFYIAPLAAPVQEKNT